MESLASQINHYVQSGTGLLILGVLLKEYRIHIRIKERLNTLWFEHCKRKEERFTPLEGNGTRG